MSHRTLSWPVRYSGASNWDPFSSHEVVIRLHCTLDIDHAMVDDLGPSPF